MLYHCQAVVVAPGGVGTLDELFEVMTLRQTLKIQSDMPIVLFGAEYWNTIVNWQALAKYGVVSPSDIEQLFITDSGALPRIGHHSNEMRFRKPITCARRFVYVACCSGGGFSIFGGPSC
jgi:predicted Rossmann-fold nucleotide-binding protein